MRQRCGCGGSYQINITDPSIPTDALTGINLPTGAALTVVDDSDSQSPSAARPLPG